MRKVPEAVQSHSRAVNSLWGRLYSIADTAFIYINVIVIGYAVNSRAYY